MFCMRLGKLLMWVLNLGMTQSWFLLLNYISWIIIIWPAQKYSFAEVLAGVKWRMSESYKSNFFNVTLRCLCIWLSVNQYQDVELCIEKSL